MTVTTPQSVPNSVGSAELLAFRESAVRFAAAEIAPHLDAWRAGEAVPTTVLQRAGDSGFLGTSAPERFGGGEADDLGFLATLIAAIVDSGAIGVSVTWALHAGVCIPYLAEHGSSEDQERWLPALIAGTSLAVPAPGSVTPGLPGAGIAELFLVADQSADTVTSVPSNAPGVLITRRPADLAAGDAGTADLDATRATPGPISGSPVDALLRDVDLWLAVVALAAARRSITLALDYASSRKVFGTALADFENTQLRLAELTAEVTSATAHVEHCLHARARGSLSAGAAAAARQVTIGLSDRSVDQSMQLHGGYGYMREYPVAHAFADARFIRTVGRLYSDPRVTIAREVFSGR